MKIAAYIQMNRISDPTGVGKHVINVARYLANSPEVNLRLLTSGQFLADGKALPPDNPLADIPITRIGWPQKYLDLSWILFGHPLADRWAGDADWLYCPAEIPVPTRRSRLAVTCHVLWWLEKNLPWPREPARPRNRLKWTWRMAQIRKHADVVFVVSEFLKQRTMELTGIEENRLVVVGNGVEQPYFDAASQPRDYAQPPYLLTVGGLTEMKGATAMLETAKLLHERKTGIELWVVGKGDPHLAHLAASVPNIRCLGYKGLDELPTLIRNAVALVSPSLYETFGIPAAEAMAAGTPPIVTPCGGLPEVVGDGGIVLDQSADAGDIVDIAVRLTSDEAHRAAIAQRGLARAHLFTWEKCGEKVLARLRA